MIRVQSTVYPESVTKQDTDTEQREIVNPQVLTLGEMINYWTNNGHFNYMLYQQLSVAKSR